MSRPPYFCHLPPYYLRFNTAETMLTIQCWYNGPRGAEYTECKLPRELCTPSCLETAAITCGALFVTCPAKYGGRQFCNPNKLKGGAK